MFHNSWCERAGRIQQTIENLVLNVFSNVQLIGLFMNFLLKDRI